MKFITFDIEELGLRRFESHDLDFIYNHYRDAHIARYLYDDEPPANYTEAKKMLKWYINTNSETHIWWCITIKEGNTPIGACGFHHYDSRNNSAEIGYSLNSKYWGKGYMAKVLTQILEYGFDTLELNKIYAYVAIANKPSINLLKKMAFKLDGIIREQFFFEEKYYDHYNYSCLKREWSQVPPAKPEA